MAVVPRARSHALYIFLLAAAFILYLATGLLAQPRPGLKVPKTHDPRLVVELFAAAPDIVHPIGLEFDSRGRLLVIESHTHFPPRDYQGPPHDRVRILEDTDGDGKADRFSTFFEGTRATMDIALHPDDSIYLATRNEILRLRDVDGDGKAERKERVVFLDTKGNYPHNGLSGLCFDSKGNLFFGMGENLGASYTLSGTDGGSIRDEGEGGNLFWCTADGKQLRRVATGFWNPFGVCRDIFGRLFAVDNDPDAMPPCRLLHVVEGGDYGYQFRYGRSGRHPFQAWNGQIPGTLPMISGTGEAPCEVVSYESQGLPPEYLGNLLVASWADHRLERYVPKAQGSSFTATRQPFVQGGKNFHPVGIAVAPDGSLFISDWGLRDYALHGRGAVWHVRWKDAPKGVKSSVANRRQREATAQQLARTDTGRGKLRQQLQDPDVRVRAASLTALLDTSATQADLKLVAGQDKEVGLRALAVRGLVAQNADVRAHAAREAPAEVRREAIAGLKSQDDLPTLVALLSDADPFLQQATVRQLARHPQLLDTLDLAQQKETAVRVGLLLAHRASGRKEGLKLLPRFLTDPSEEVRFLAVKWIADQRLTDYRPAVVELLRSQNPSVKMFLAGSTALARLDGREVSDARLADYFLERIADAKATPELRRQALQLVPVSHARLTLGLLDQLLKQDDPKLRLEAVRALAEHPRPERKTSLLRVAQDESLALPVRAQAVAGLATYGSEFTDQLLALARGKEAVLRDEALRSLVEVPLTPAQRTELEPFTRQQAPTADLAARVLGRSLAQNRPKLDAVSAWLKRLEGSADAEVGRRIFFHVRVANCSACHRVDGRGHDIGPDLSGIGRTERRHLLESILQPSNLIAPHYQSWVLEMNDGRVLTGMLVRTYLDEYTYLDSRGITFKVTTRDIATSQPSPLSIMPAELVNRLTDQELRDLLAYLETRK